jgi:hypothetical protein
VVGLIVQTQVTLPDGQTRVLETTLTAADIAAGQHYPDDSGGSALLQDGSYGTQTVIMNAGR